MSRAISLVLTVLLALGAQARASDDGRSPEYLIKAAYLYNFALFVEWPANAFASPEAPLVIGIVGPDPFGTAMDRTVQGKRINRHPIRVERLQANQDLRHCHILFVSRSELARAGEIAQRLQGLPVLIVGDAADATRRAAAVEFLLTDNKVGFAINLEAARRARLTVSSKMLGLARAVR